MSNLQRNSLSSVDRRPDLGYSSVPPGGALGRISGSATPGLDRLSQQPNFNRTSVSRTQEELRRRSEYPTQLNISLMIQEADTGAAVYYKQDGSRFQHSEETLKFREGEVYKITLLFKPQLRVLEDHLTFAYVHDKGMSARDVVNLNFQSMGDKAALSGSWKCVIQPTGNKSRLNMYLEFTVENFGIVEIPLCGKVYASKNKAYKTGFPLKSAVYDYRAQGQIPNQKASLRTATFIK